MRCAIHGTTLVIADRSGVEIDDCPQCGGVWWTVVSLTRSSNGPRRLHRLCNLSVESTAAGTTKKKRGSFLDEIFDF